MRSRLPHIRSVIAFVFILLATLFAGFPTVARAGGGPEGVLLVVNPLSPASLTIANHYVQLRAIPADNLLYLPWQLDAQMTNIEVFRQRLLVPILTAIRNRGMGRQIDYIVYSSDFPWAITLDSDIKKFLKEAQEVENAKNGISIKRPNENAAAKLEWPAQRGTVGSINGLTYLWQPVVAGFPAYFDLKSNYYMRIAPPNQPAPPSLGFRGMQEYDPHGEAVVSGGRRYFLSTMLGVTAKGGNSLGDILQYLKRSAAADATHPKGTIYFVKNKDVRSTVRDSLFPAAVDALNGMGVHAEILQGTVPLNKSDVQGVVMGTAAFDWKASGSTILPGAICEHFTSFGGVMSGNNGQTQLSEFLRYGAAGASGTVIEPYSIIDKFPVPMIQVHYARGCTLAEAFYQAVHGPYQLLIVGDPLCRPWADVPDISVAGVKENDVLRGTFELKPSATLPPDQAVSKFELYIDAQLVAECLPEGTLSFDTLKAPDGHHELRIVAIGPAPIASQGRKIVPVQFDNHQRKIEASLTTQGPYHVDTPLRIDVQAPGSMGVVVIQGSRIVGQLRGERGQINIPPKALGGGPIRLRVAGLGNNGPPTNVFAAPIDFMID